jgi:alpha-glutamyl/putrescinyl thymine pyrophosphorylase clade 1
MKQSSFDFENNLRVFNDDFSPRGKIIDGKWYAADYTEFSDIESRLHAFYDFARERHAIYLRRAQGLPKPWTNDPTLSSYRFTNVYRELDTVSVWVIKNILEPYEDHPYLWFMLCAARIVNWPPSLQAMMEAKDGFGIKMKYNPDAAFNALMKRRAQKEKTITGAYIVNSVTSKNDPEHIQGNKLAYICYRTLGEIWEKRDEIKGEFKSTLENSVQTLKRFQGYGAFMSYQITVDLSYSDKWLKKASDYNTFNSAGPGTCRGLSRVFHGKKVTRMDDEEKTKLLAFQLKASRNPAYWPNTHKDMTKGFAPLSMSNCSNLNCEFSKHSAVFFGEGRMRSSYPGGLNDHFTSKASLF